MKVKKKQQKSVGKKPIFRKEEKKSIPHKRNWWLPIGFAILAMLLYAPSINYDFVYDDDAVLKDNRFVQKGFAGLGDIWTTSYFKGFNENINARAFRPIPLTQFAIENQFFGLNSKVHHGVSVLLFGLTAFFLFLFLSRLLRAHHKLLPAVATLLFVIHPIHIEVVANIKSRDELNAFLCFIIAAWALLKSFDEKSKIYQPLSWLFFAIALFSKESALTTLAIIPLLLWFFRAIDLKNIALKTAPYFLIAVGYLIVRSSILGGLNEGVQLTVLDNSLLAAANVSERIASNIYVLGIYFFKNLIPHPLLSDYSYSTIPIVGWGDYRVWLSILLYGALIGAMLFGFWKKKIYSFAILWFFVTVSIFSSVFVLNVNAYADRFNYNPSFGVCLLVAWALCALLPKDLPFGKYFPKFSDAKSYVSVFSLSALALLGIWKLESHLPVWKDRYALFAHDVKAAPTNARMLKNHGGSLARQAMFEKDKTRQKEIANEAIEYLQRALNVYDRLSTGHVHLGNMYGLIGDVDKAGAAYERALQIDSKSYTGNTNLANVYYRKGRYEEALDLMNKVNQNQFSKNDHYLISLIYGKLGHSAKAAEHRTKSGR